MFIKRCQRIGSMSVFFGVCLFVFSAANAEEKFDSKQLIGKWEYLSGNRAGKILERDHFKKELVSVDEKSFTLTGAGGKFVMNYKIDASTSPAKVNFEITESPFGAGMKTAGVITVKDGKMKLCYSSMGGAIPTELKVAEGSDQFMFTLAKQPAELKAEHLLGTWKYLSGNRGGEVRTAEDLEDSVVVDKKNFTLKGSEATFVMSYKLNLEATPQEIDFTIVEGPFAIGGKAPGIIKFEDEKLTVAYAVGADRPTDFKAGEGKHMFVLKKN